MNAKINIPKENLLIFDIDGTLTDSVKIHQHCFSTAVKKFSIKEHDTNYAMYMHHTDHHIFKTIFENSMIQSLEYSTIDVFEQHFVKELFANLNGLKIAEISGALNFINYILEKTNYAIVYATGSFDLPARIKLEHCNLPFIDDLLVSSNIYETREQLLSESITKAQKYFNVNQFTKIIALGDGIWDLKAAQNMNIGFIGIGKVNKELLLNHGADIVFDDYSNYQNILHYMELTP
jgi:phosphoglycolate phosphatase-like HAD superfamily hydrolase